MARCVTVLCVLVLCLMCQDIVGKSTDLNIQNLERDLLIELVDLAFDTGDKTLNEHIQRKELSAKTNNEGSQSNSYRKYHSFKRQSQEAREIEKHAVRALAATEELITLTGMSLEELKNNKDVVDAFKQNMQDTEKRELVTRAEPCEVVPTCNTSALYRTADGSCNNLKSPNTGKALTPQTRLLSNNAYDNGINTPRTKAKSGNPLPSARAISNRLFQNLKDPVKDNRYSVMVMAWGQFLDHDITLTPVSSAADGSSITCCGATTSQPECFPIDLPTPDPHFTSNCMEFVRSSAAVATCAPGAREQLNEITAFVDASMVYGSSQEKTKSLRSNIGGRLATSPVDLPPAGPATGCVHADSSSDYCLSCGDVRANVVPSLGANHVLFVREHNRIAAELTAVNPTWTDEQLFQETRKVVIAIIQRITYNEWLPTILDKPEMEKHKLTNNDRDIYDDNVDSSIKNEFAVAALRYGHSLITPVQAYLLQDYKTYTEKRLETVFLDPMMAVANQGDSLPLLARWVTTNESMKADRILEKEIRNLLFLDAAGHSFDLGSLNLQRGRDHGIPSYNDYRSLCGLKKATSFAGLADHTQEIQQILKDIYESVDDIDLYAGGLSETPTSNVAKVGPVFSCIIGRQFKDLMYGDRFWYRQSGTQGFTSDQLTEISKMTLAKVMCTNFHMEQIQNNVFQQIHRQNQLQLCNNVPDMNFDLWKEGTGGNTGGGDRPGGDRPGGNRPGGGRG